MSDIKLKIGKRIKELRIKHNLKQSELAEMVGIGTKHQSCIETGKNFPSADLFENYAVAFNMDVTDILSIKPFSFDKSRKEIIANIVKNINTASDYELFLIDKIIDIISVNNKLFE